MDISTKTTTELKAIAYDLIIQIEVTQKNLQLVNQEISKKLEAEKEVVTPEIVKAE